MRDDAHAELHVRSRFRAAAYRAKQIYPGAVGELLSREIMSWEEFGYRLGGEALMSQVVTDVLDRPVPDAEAA
ncbi:MAG: hypothetical protein GEV09_00995 [Pseudonocardiaceae bacterium]|nr:hypothetical protein [Pseudonocardiaceae bacterium]